MTGSFEGCKVVDVGGSSGMGNAVIIGRNEARVDETVAELGKQGTAWGITADLARPRPGRGRPGATRQRARGCNPPGGRGRLLHPQAVPGVRRGALRSVLHSHSPKSLLEER
jgi:hypothetical protein